MQLEKTILTNLIHNENYARKVIPFLKEEYFTASHDRIVFKLINNFITKYNDLPSTQILALEADTLVMSADEAKNVSTLVADMAKEGDEKEEWLIDTTEKFCKEKAIYHALMQSIEIMNGSSKVHDRGMIPQLLTDALAVSFDPNVGHDFLEQFVDRYEYYHRKEEKMPFDLDYFNKATRGGVPRKTLNVVMAGTNVGKSLFMCHLAAAALNEGKNVLYITLELAEKEVARRIDVNLLNLTFDDLELLPQSMYESKLESLRSKTNGKLVIKEYPTASANANHFRALLNELYLKKSFKPDIICIDYLNICASSRMKPGGSINSYMFVKAIAEELRGLAVETNTVLWTATQTNRQGFDNSDVDLTNTSESFGLPATADFMFALVSSEELQQLGQFMVKQLKSRYNDPSIYKRFVIGVDKTKMRLYDVEESAQEGITDSGIPQDIVPFDVGEFSSRYSKEKLKEIRV
jgi:archaellum biogenesis ATPase FlaH